MESPPAGDGFELVEKEDPTWCTDDEYEFVEAPVERHAAPPPAAHAHPGGGGDQAFRPPGRETIIGCGQGYHTETIVKSTSPQGAVALTRSLSPQSTRSLSPPPTPQKARAEAEEVMKIASPLSFYEVAAAMDKAPGLLHDLVNLMGRVSDLDAAPPPAHGYAPVASRLSAAHGAGDGEADEDDDDEVTEEEEEDDDYALYESCYNLADFGRSRRVKRSSGRRGRTKKATTRGRPRGEVRSSHIAGNL